MISVIRALAVGAIGGALAFVIGVPAPWLAGSLVATIIAVYSNQNLELPDWLRTLAFILLGIQTGTAVNADTLYRASAMAVEHCVHEHHRGAHRLGLHVLL